MNSTIIRKCGFQSIPFRSALVATLILGTTAFVSADVKLKGSVGPRTIDDNVVIARNTTCTLNGTRIKGNIRVLAGAKLIANGADITDNVQAFDSFIVDLRQSSRINGDVRGEGTRSVLVRGGTHVGGSVQIKEASAPSGVSALSVKNATVEGDLEVE